MFFKKVDTIGKRIKSVLTETISHVSVAGRSRCGSRIYMFVLSCKLSLTYVVFSGVFIIYSYK